MKIAAEQALLWRDGVWFVPLAGAPDAAHRLDVLAAALGLQTAGRSLEPADLIDFLRAKELLLILDGFEHLADGGLLLRDILHWAPKVRVLATSRARLGLQGEWAVQLDGLEMPDDLPATAAEAEGYSAVQLFLQNARRVKSGFALSPENLPHVLRICRLVEGLPLGIELAAARVRMFSCRQIADEIEQSLDFLHDAGGDVDETVGHALLGSAPPGAQGILAAAYNLLQERAAKITDEALRRSFLENVASHWEIMREYEGDL